MVKFCPNCGAKISDTTDVKNPKFCPECGKLIINSNTNKISKDNNKKKVKSGGINDRLFYKYMIKKQIKEEYPN